MDVGGAVDFFADLDAGLGDGFDGGAFPGAAGGPHGEALGQRGDGEEVVEALPGFVAEAYFVAAGVEVRLELEEVDYAEVAVGLDGVGFDGGVVVGLVGDLGAEGEVGVVGAGDGGGLSGGEAGHAFVARADASGVDGEV